MGVAASGAGWLGEALTRVRSRRMSRRILTISVIAALLLAVLSASYVSRVLGRFDRVTEVALGTSFFIYSFVVLSLGLNRRVIRSTVASS